MKETYNQANKEKKADRKFVDDFLSFIPFYKFLSDLCNKYDKTFVQLLAFQYFNQGCKALLSLAVKDYFKEYLQLEPGHTAVLQSFISFPWSIKLFYGIISDNLPIFGFKRKSYVILMGALQFISLIIVYIFEVKNEKLIAFLLFLSSLSGAYLDVLVDALMVVQSRLDQDEGSEELQSLSWGCMGAGGICGSLAGGFLTQNYHPKYSFLIYSIFGLIVMLLGLNLNKSADNDFEEDIKKEKKSFLNSLKESLQNILIAIKMPEIYMTLLFYLCVGMTEPSFGEFSYYFQMNVVKFTKFEYAMFGVLGYTSLSLGTVYYNMYLKEKEVRTLLRYACLISCFGALLNLTFAYRLNLQIGIKDIYYILFTDVVLGTLGLAYSQLPTMVLFAKITPSNIEASCFAFLTGTLNFSNGVLSPMIGTKINEWFVGVSSEDLSKYKILVLISFITSFIPFAYLWMIPLKEDIKHLQDEREKQKTKES